MAQFSVEITPLPGSVLGGNQQILADKMPAHLSASHIAQNLPLDWEGQQRWIAAQA
jgi:hypothetical protein